VFHIVPHGHLAVHRQIWRENTTTLARLTLISPCNRPSSRPVADRRCRI
jgi:hypothetical protein